MRPENYHHKQENWYFHYAPKFLSVGLQSFSLAAAYPVCMDSSCNGGPVTTRCILVYSQAQWLRSAITLEAVAESLLQVQGQSGQHSEKKFF